MKHYTLAEIMSYENHVMDGRPGSSSSRFDKITKSWRMRIQLDEERIWFLSVFTGENGEFEKYSLDRELAEDSHFEFTDEKSIREKLFEPGDEKRHFGEILVRYVKKNSGNELLRTIYPFVTAQYHFD